MRTWARVPLALLLMVAAVHHVLPSEAFDSADLATRDVAAHVVADASSYNAIAGGACSNVPLTGGTCTFTISNLATKPQTYTVTLQEDLQGAVSTYALTGATPVSSGAVSTPSQIAVGASTTLTADLADCASCAGQTRAVYWKVDGSSANAIDSSRNRFPMSITYASS